MAPLRAHIDQETATLGVAVGFLPRLDLPGGTGAAAVSVLALVSTLTQPVVGRLRDAGRLATRVGAVWGLTAAAVGIGLLAVVPHPVTLFLAAALIGAMIGVVTPLAFAHLAETTPPERMGRTMGNAEMGRELGDAGGPLLVGAVATATALPVALGALAATSLVVGGIAWRSLGTPAPPGR